MTKLPIPPSDEEALRPVLYELGKTVYLAQQFEHSLGLLNAMLTSSEGLVTADSFKSGLSTQGDLTLGQVMKRFQKKLGLPIEFESFLREGVDARNRVSHGFVSRNAENLRTAVGRATMIDELDETQRILHSRFGVISAALDAALKAFGGSLEQLEAKARFTFEADFLDAKVRH